MAIRELQTILQGLMPELDPTPYVFCSSDKDIAGIGYLNPIATFYENEGLSIVIKQVTAEREGLNFTDTFCKITLSVYSSLESVGLTAAVSTKLAQHNISANVIAAFHHDHIFVPQADAERALRLLVELSEQSFI